VRQIYDAARPRILELTGQSKFSYGYFSQTLLPSYERGNAEETATWDVISDAQ
jgi:hypothetical protein